MCNWYIKWCFNSHYLKDYNIISSKDINTFIQGESMGRSSTILSRYKEDGITIRVGECCDFF